LIYVVDESCLTLVFCVARAEPYRTTITAVRRRAVRGLTSTKLRSLVYALLTARKVSEHVPKRLTLMRGCSRQRSELLCTERALSGACLSAHSTLVVSPIIGVSNPPTFPRSYLLMRIDTILMSATSDTQAHDSMVILRLLCSCNFFLESIVVPVVKLSRMFDSLIQKEPSEE